MTPVLVLTLNPNHAGGQAVFELARQHGVLDVIENHGDLTPEKIDALYRTLHLFVFPSLCESFGFPMVEAMAYGLPLLVAAVDSNIEIAGAAGQAFPPHDADTLAAHVKGYQKILRGIKAVLGPARRAAYFRGTPQRRPRWI